MSLHFSIREHGIPPGVDRAEAVGAPLSGHRLRFNKEFALVEADAPYLSTCSDQQQRTGRYSVDTKFQRFEFDSVHTFAASQEAVFAATAQSSLVPAFLEGKHCVYAVVGSNSRDRSFNLLGLSESDRCGPTARAFLRQLGDGLGVMPRFASAVFGSSSAPPATVLHIRCREFFETRSSLSHGGEARVGCEGERVDLHAWDLVAGTAIPNPRQHLEAEKISVSSTEQFVVRALECGCQ